MDPNNTCKFCSKHYKSDASLKYHIRRCVKNPEFIFFSCPHCKQTFTRKNACESHLQTYCQNDRKKSKLCILENCNFKYLFKSSLIAHLRECHDMFIKPEEHYNFNTWEEFLLWKDQEEFSTMSFYSQQSGQKRNRYLYFYCQHDGSSERHSKLSKDTTKDEAQKRTKKEPRGRKKVKKNDVCISMMKVYIAGDRSVQVTYYSTHSHSMEKNESPAPGKRTKKQKIELSKIKILTMNRELMDVVQNGQVPLQFLSHVGEVLTKLLSECRTIASDLKTNPGDEIKS